MIKIRKNVFETNSSSVYSICLCNLGKNATKKFHQMKPLTLMMICELPILNWLSASTTL